MARNPNAIAGRKYLRLVADDNHAFEVLARGLLGRASAEIEATVGAPFDGRVHDSITLMAHGEAVVAFENLADNVCEYDLALSKDELREFQRLADAWGVPASRRIAPR